jgi:hypothetical protein
MTSASEFGAWRNIGAHDSRQADQRPDRTNRDLHNVVFEQNEQLLHNSPRTLF